MSYKRSKDLWTPLEKLHAMDIVAESMFLFPTCYHIYQKKRCHLSGTSTNEFHPPQSAKKQRSSNCTRIALWLMLFSNICPKSHFNSFSYIAAQSKTSLAIQISTSTWDASEEMLHNILNMVHCKQKNKKYFFSILPFHEELLPLFTANPISVFLLPQKLFFNKYAFLFLVSSVSQLPALCPFVSPPPLFFLCISHLFLLLFLFLFL